MDQLSARQGTACPSNSAFYVCSQGPFRGCCSVDPCSTGICPDRNSNNNINNILAASIESDGGGDAPGVITVTTLATGTATATGAASKTDSTIASPAVKTESATRTTTATAATSSTAANTDEDKANLTSSASMSTPASTSSTSIETLQPTTTAATNASVSKKNHSNPALIGGIVGAVAAALLITALIVYLVYQRKRKKRKNCAKRFTLLRWRRGPCVGDDGLEDSKPLQQGIAIDGAEAGADRGGSSPPLAPQPSRELATQPHLTTATATATATQSNCSTPAPPPPHYRLPTIPEDESLQLVLSSQTPPAQNLNLNLSLGPSQSPNSTNPTTTNSASISTTPTARPTIPSDLKTPSSYYSGLAAVPSYPDAIHPAVRPCASTSTPTPGTSLPDTTTTSKPNHHYNRHAQPHSELPASPTPTRSQTKRAAPGLPLPIVTPDGAVLSANFHSLPAGPDSHAMSFMEFSIESEHGHALTVVRGL